LYEPAIASFLPIIIEDAYEKNYVLLGHLIDKFSELMGQDLDAGTNLAYRCADLDPFISTTQLANEASRSFAGDLRALAERQGCAIWKVDPMPAEFNDPVRSAVPMLMVQGLDDPATPPESAEKAVATLPNAKLLLVRGAGHGVFTKCVIDAEIRFIRQSNANGISGTDCAGSFEPPAFQTSLSHMYW
jgi:pimeloyl-ACP methyl ester carboxylesterase